MPDRIIPLLNELELAIKRLRAEWENNKSVSIPDLSKLTVATGKLEREVFK